MSSYRDEDGLFRVPSYEDFSEELHDSQDAEPGEIFSLLGQGNGLGYQVFLGIGHRSTPTFRNIADALDEDTPSVMKIGEEFERRGYAERGPNGWGLTERGYATLQAVDTFTGQLYEGLQEIVDAEAQDMTEMQVRKRAEREDGLYGKALEEDADERATS